MTDYQQTKKKILTTVLWQRIKQLYVSNHEVLAQPIDTVSICI